MSFVYVVPETALAAAGELSAIGQSIATARAAVALPTTAILAAAEDEVSAEIAALFGAHGQAYQALSGQAAAFHDEFVQGLRNGMNSYAAAEAAQRQILDGINAPFRSWLGRPLIGNGADAPVGSGQLSLIHI